MEQPLLYEFARALSHPLRAQILAMLADEPLSAVQIANGLGEKLGDVAYHVKELRSAGMIVKVGERNVRGATETFYRAPWRVRLSVVEVRW